MAILPRTLLTQPAAAAVGAVALFGFTIVGLAAHEQHERQQLRQQYSAPCLSVEKQLGAQQHWRELDYVRYASCFEDQGDSARVIEVASDGLTSFPHSQMLYNLKGYHAIELHEFDLAVQTLEQGLREVPEQTNGVMENNLAWAYLWVGQGDTDTARALYQASLTHGPASCETLHTGLFVEFETARNTSGVEQAEALRNFQSLRTRYQACENRDTQWSTTVETAGAAVLYEQTERLLGSTWDQRGQQMTMLAVATSLRSRHSGAPVGSLCQQALPLRDLRASCEDDVADALSAIRR